MHTEVPTQLYAVCAPMLHMHIQRYKSIYLGWELLISKTSLLGISLCLVLLWYCTLYGSIHWKIFSNLLKICCFSLLFLFFLSSAVKIRLLFSIKSNDFWLLRTGKKHKGTKNKNWTTTLLFLKKKPKRFWFADDRLRPEVGRHAQFGRFFFFFFFCQSRRQFEFIAPNCWNEVDPNRKRKLGPQPATWFAPWP